MRLQRVEKIQKLGRIETSPEPAPVPDGRGEPAAAPGMREDRAAPADGAGEPQAAAAPLVAVKPDEPRAAASAPERRDEPPRDETRRDARDGKADKRGELRERALQASYDEYKELTGAWRYLDTKAQGNIAVAGIFIAAAFAYLARFTPAGLEAVILIIIVFFLVVSVLLSVRVLRVQDAPPHYLGDFMRRQVRDLEGMSDEEFRGHLPSFYRQHAELWNNSGERLIATLKSQAEALWVAQAFLIVAILSAAVLVAIKLFI